MAPEQEHNILWDLLQEKESGTAMAKQPYRLLERSIFCDRMVFVESLKDSQYLSEMELTIYDSWCVIVWDSCHHACLDYLGL